MRKLASNEAAVLEERNGWHVILHDTVSQQLFAIHMSPSSLPKLLEINRERLSVMDAAHFHVIWPRSRCGLYCTAASNRA